jgi:PAS domain S-box-containing protein
VFKYLQGSRRAVLTRALILTAFIAFIDWRIDLDISFGFLYMFPLLLVGTVFSRWQVVLAAVFCSALSDVFDPFPFTWPISLSQDMLVFTALAGTGLFSLEATRRRRLEEENTRRLELEVTARREAEEQLEFLISSSPAAILTTDSNGRILLANAGAHQILGAPACSLKGQPIWRFIPALGHVPLLDQTSQAFRTEMQCRGERENGETFVANVFFSTYFTNSGPRMAALIVDGSDELREREEFTLQQTMAGSRILVGAVSHEIRNVCGAIAVIHENLTRSGVLKGTKDFEALGALVETLHKIASLELRGALADGEAGIVDVREVLGDWRIVLEPHCRDSGITATWNIAEDLPLVWADRHRLLQVLLNLTKNSERALENSETKRIDITVRPSGTGVSLFFSDSGPGLASPSDTLFQPFQKGAESTGLGLYLSRALLRSFGGDLRYVAAPSGCTFAVDLAPAENHSPSSNSPNHDTDTALVSG